MRSPIFFIGASVCAAALLGCSDAKMEAPARLATGGGSASTPDSGVPGTGGSSSTGGSSTGSGGSPGSGGVTGTSGSGGNGGTGGTTAADGGGGETDAGSGDAGFVPNPATVDVVACKNGKSCTASEVCCYTPPALLPPVLSSFTCSSKPCTGTDVAISCDGREDCASGQKCCRVDSPSGLLGNTTSYTCRDSCTGPVIGCGGPDACPSGEVCCETVLLTTTTGVACSKTCSGIGLYVLCHEDADCPAATPSCVESTTLPGFRHCL